MPVSAEVRVLFSTDGEGMVSVGGGYAFCFCRRSEPCQCRQKVWRSRLVCRGGAVGGLQRVERFIGNADHGFLRHDGDELAFTRIHFR